MFVCFVYLFQILYQNDESVDDGNNGANNDNNTSTNNDNMNNSNNNNNNIDNVNGTDGAIPPLPNEEAQRGVQGEITNNFSTSGASKMEDVTMDGQSMNQENIITM